MWFKIFYSIDLLLLVVTSVTIEEKNQLRLQVRDMFKHAYGSYMVGEDRFEFMFTAFFFDVDIRVSGG